MNAASTFPLTFEQEARLARDAFEFAEGRQPYPDHVVWSSRLRGPLVASALDEAVAAVAERHVALGLRVVEEPDGALRQAPTPGAPALEHVDWTARRGPDAGFRAARQAVEEEAWRRFEPGTPLSRWQLHAIGPDDHVLLCVADHLVIDAAGFDVLLTDLHDAYVAAVGGRSQDLEPAPSFTAFADWQRAMFSELPPPRPSRPPRVSFPFALSDDPQRLRRGATHVRGHLDAALLRRLAASAVRHRATPVMALVGAYQAMLQSLSGAERIAIASTVVNRWRPEFASCVGWLAHYVVIEAELGPEATGAEALQRARDACIGAYEGAEYPFALAAQRTIGEAWKPCDYHPDVVLNYVVTRPDHAPFRPPGIHDEPFDITPTTPHTTLSFFAVEREEGIDVALRYDTGALSHAHAQDALRRLRAAVEWLASRPHAALGAELGPPLAEVSRSA